MSGSIRLFVDSPLAEGVTVPLAQKQAHYLGTVMRRGAGSEVVVFNGRDGEFSARIASMSRGAGTLELGGLLRPQAAPPPLTLAFALLKRDATDLVVEKATELGATRIAPLITARTQAGHVNLDRLRAIAIEAAEQCERLEVPEVCAPEKLERFLMNWPKEQPLVAAIERGADRPIGGYSSGAATGYMVGPEGGFAPVELDLLRRCSFVVPASLGPRILRAETACIAGLALLGAASGAEMPPPALS